jgi:sigma-54-specific transcriptional regulator
MNDQPRPVKLLTLPNAGELPLSIRAKAMTFYDRRSLELLSYLERLAPTDANVLMVGETGTGKELVARFLHEFSGRGGPFVAVNCGAFSETLIEAELFGHESGAFTGAQHARQGWFEAAGGGTLFLDEIGDMPLLLQGKLLRVLQERYIVRIGSRKAIPIDVRLVAATNVNLERAVENGLFRRDLYYRLNVAPVNLPPLRERRDDILPLANHFVAMYGQKLGLTGVCITRETERQLLAYNWPGNIRELENIIHFALIMSQDNRIEPHDLRLPSQAAGSAHYGGSIDERLIAVFRQMFAEEEREALYEGVERLLVTTAFEHCGGNQVRTAKHLGISRNILRTQLKRFGLLARGGDSADGDDEINALGLALDPLGYS